MKTEHEFAQVLRWIADGETVQTQGSNGTWFESTDKQLLQDIYEELHIDRFRLSPRTITVNGREVQAGETKKPEGKYFVALPTSESLYLECFEEHNYEQGELWLERGLVHLTEEAAIAHAKAMLNID